jgi:3-oxoacyl-[acyl-carrier-protein] synthase-3
MGQVIRNVSILGTGGYVPLTVLTNAALAEKVPTSPEWVANTLGIKERRIVKAGEYTSDLASRAALDALADARLSPFAIDLIIVATATPDKPAPSTACIVREKIKAYNAAAFDLNAVCTGFIYGLTTAAQFISSGMYDNILVIGADTFSRETDWTKRDCVFFGDGAGAVVLSRSLTGGFFAANLYADSHDMDGFYIDKGACFTMDGKKVYENALSVLPSAIKHALNEVCLTPEDIDHVIPHQPSLTMLQHIFAKAGIPFNKVHTNMAKYANTVGATVPLLLNELNKSNKLKAGDTLLLVAIGSGWTYGTILLRWEKEDTYFRG